MMERNRVLISLKLLLRILILGLSTGYVIFLVGNRSRDPDARVIIIITNGKTKKSYLRVQVDSNTLLRSFYQ